MTRRNAAWLAAAVTALLAAAYLLSRRRTPSLTPSTENPQGHSPEDFVEVAAAVPVVAAAPVVAAVAVPATSPLPATAPVDTAEPPLPTWVRVAIVGVALVAFFAVSLIATKGV